MRADPSDANRSCWIEEASPVEARPALARDEKADVAIVGGGFTGVSTAWHLAERFPDRRIVLLEARVLGHGASGRSGGQALTGINGIEPEDPAAARRIYDATRGGIDLIADLVARHRIDAGFSRGGCLEVYTRDDTAEAAQARLARLRAAGLPLDWVPGKASGIEGARGAIRDPSCGRVNGVALLRALGRLLVNAGVGIYENTPVVRIDEGATIVLTTARARVRAAAIVLATNAYTPRLGYFRHQILPLHSHVVATRPLPDEEWARLGWGAHDGWADDLDRIAFGCRTAGGRLLFGGGGNDAYGYSFGGDPVFRIVGAGGPFDALERRLARHFPALETPVLHRWTGPIALTLDRVCSMGVRDNVYHALGYSGHGVALAMLAGRVLCDLYGGEHAPWRDLPFYQRRLPYLPPEPLRWLGYQVYTRMTGRSPRRRAG